MKLSRNWCLLLALVPLVYLVGLIARYSVEVPYMDEWEFVPLLERTYQGSLTFHELWEQHNEHRIIFPRLILLAMARLTGWNHNWGLALNVALACALFAVLTGQIRKTRKDLNCESLYWAVPACSLIVFSISQFENWLWGWQMQMLLNVLAASASLILLASRPFSWLKFASASLLGIVATYSFANGLLVWPIGLVVIFLATAGRSEKKSSVGIWLLLGLLMFWSYMWHYQKPVGHPSLLSVLQWPVEYACYALVYLGGTCAEYNEMPTIEDSVIALACGGVSLAALCWSGWLLKRRMLADWNGLLPYLGMSLYSIGSALMTGIGRVGFGSMQALHSRYCTMTLPFWVSLVVFMLLLMQGRCGRRDDLVLPGKQGVPEHSRAIAQFSLRAIIVLLALSSIGAMDAMRARSRLQAFGRRQLLQLAADPIRQTDHRGLVALYPHPEIVLERYPVLVEHRLSLFRNPSVVSSPASRDTP
jgi:hypothetical protein